MNALARDAAIALGLAAAYVVAALPVVKSPVGANFFVWPSSGVAVAALVLWGWRLAPGVLAGAFAAELMRQGALAAAGLALAHTAEAVVAAWLVARLPGFRPQLDRTRDALVAVFAGAMASAAAGATLAAAFVSGATTGAFGQFWLDWSVAHALGTLFVAPFLLTWFGSGAPRLGEREMLAAGLLLGAAAAMGVLGFSGMLGPTMSQYLLWYALFPLMVSSATWLRPRETATVNLAVVCVFMWVTPSATLAGQATSGVLLLHGFLAIASIATLILSATTSEYRRSERELAESEQRFRSLTSLSSDWYWEQDAEGRFTFASEQFFRRYGIQPGTFIGRRRWEVSALQPAEGSAEAYRDVFEAHKPYRDLILRRTDPDGSVHYIASSGEPVFDAQGAFRGYRGVGRDITESVEAQEALRASRERFSKIFHASPSPISISSYDTGRFLDVNEAWLAMLGFAHHEVVNRTAMEIGIWAGAADRDAFMQALARDGAVRNLESRQRAKDGRLIEVLRSSELIELEGKRWILSILSDITELKRAAQQLRESERRFADVVDAAGEYVWEVDVEGRFRYVSDRVEQMLGYAPAELMGRRPADLMPPEEAERVTGWLAKNLKGLQPFRNFEHMMLTKSGHLMWQQVSGVPVRGADGRYAGYRGTSFDITERKRSEQRIEELATRDPLTGLPNRLLLADRLGHAITTARRKGEMLALLFVDLDHFKTINDSLGHPVGDAVLKDVAVKFGAAMRKGDTLARLGGDEFVVLVEGLRQPEDAGAVAQKLVHSLATPIAIDGHRLNTSCSVGISVFPDDGADGTTLLRNADMAMYSAKDRHRGDYQFFSREMNVRAMEKLAIESSLRQGLQAGQFELYFQPKFSLRNGRLTGMEALVRWHHPERGLLLPGRFIPVAEETGLIVPLGEWVLRAACAQARAWRDAGHAAVPIAVNLSVVQLARGLPDLVAGALAAAGLEAGALELEITESLLMKNVEENIATLRQLSDAGVRIAIDDFGTGYSSLGYLRRFKLDTLKVDQTFVRDIESSEDGVAIVRAVVALAKSLKLKVVAEGVENDAQVELLRRLHCDEWQGYRAGQPLPSKSFQERYFGGAA